MKKLTLTEAEQGALLEAWAVPLTREELQQLIAEQKILKDATRQQSEKFYQLLIMKTEAEERDWRQWLIDTGLIKWLVQCEADSGTKNLAQRVKNEWGEFAEEYNLKEHFNKAYTDVINQHK